MHYFLDNTDPEDVACAEALVLQLVQLDITAKRLDVSPSRLMVAMFKVANRREWLASIVEEMTDECRRPTLQ